MAINTSKVVVGGLAAGVVANIVGFLGFGVLLGSRFVGLLTRHWLSGYAAFCFTWTC